MTFFGAFGGVILMWFCARPESFGRHLAFVSRGYLTALAQFEEEKKRAKGVQR